MRPPTPSESPYHPISHRYRARFGRKVYKISVGTAETCPVRTGGGGTRVCIFCDEWGSAAHAPLTGAPLPLQIAEISATLRRRYRAEAFLVYFQAYTTTFGQVARLRGWMEEALAQPGVVGLVVGTRPDCLPAPVLDVLAEYAGRTYLAVELGVQSLDDAQLRFLSRGHDAATALRGLEKVRALPGVDVDAHLMFGLPGEDAAQLRQCAATLADLGVDGVKLHNLHVLRGTPLETLYRQGRFHPLELEAYAERVIPFLEHLPPRVAVHRLSAVASRWEELVAPEWVREKMRPTQYIIDTMRARGTWQGRLYDAGDAPAANLAGDALDTLPWLSAPETGTTQHTTLVEGAS